MRLHLFIVGFLFVFVPRDNECDSYLKVENIAKRRHINIVRKPLPSPSREAASLGCWSSRVILGLWCPPCSVQMHVPKQAEAVPWHHMKSTGPLLQCCAPFLLHCQETCTCPFAVTLSCHLLPSANDACGLVCFP